MIPGPEKIAVAMSVLLHGALAATAVWWPSDPVPFPIEAAISVELVSIAPEPGSGASPEVEISAETESSSEPAIDPVFEPPEEPVVEQTEEPVVERTEEPVEEQAEESVVEPVEEVVADVAEEMVEPVVTPVEEVVADFAEEISPEPETVVDPHPVFEVSPRRPVRQAPPLLAKITPPRRPVLHERMPTAVLSPPSPMPPSPSPPSQSKKTDAAQTASLPEGSSGAGVDEPGSSDPGGLFVGPGFRLGTARNPLPRYPKIARRRGLEGRVIVRVVVGVDGKARSLRIASSSAHRMLDEAALKALQKWRFEPARRAGIPVEAPVEIPIAFRLHD
ncbi:MAG: TonB family protein [Rhodospirillales bacterium]|jgi:periplasmic protein TonB|nr:TonB family protein [Rhodospirillales bacterium]